MVVLQHVVKYKILKQFERVLLRVQEHQFGAMIKNRHFNKLSSEYSHKKFSSSSSQSSIDSRTEAYWRRTAKRVCKMDYRVKKSWYLFFEQNHLQRWGSLMLIVEIVAFEVQKIHMWLLRNKFISNMSTCFVRILSWRPFFYENTAGQTMLLHDNPVFLPILQDIIALGFFWSFRFMLTKPRPLTPYSRK